MHYSVHKFGGASVDNITDVHDILEAEAGTSLPVRPVGVVSSFSGHTDQLLQIADEIIKNPYATEHEIRMEFAPLLQSIVEKTEKGLGNEFGREEYVQVLQNFVTHFTLVIIPEVVDFIMGEVQKLIDSNGNYLPEHFAVIVTDRIVGLGEIFSHEILARVFTIRSKVKKKYRHLLLSAESGVFIPPEDVTALITKDDLFKTIVGSIRPQVEQCLRAGEVPIVSGYITHVPGGILQTIDRGYTDTTAAMTAVALRDASGGPHSVSLTMHKEVPGVMSADPRIVEPGYDPRTYRKESDFHVTRIRKRMGYRELAELSVLAGMKAVNENVLFVLDGMDVTLRIRNTLDPSARGTTVHEETETEHRGVRFVAGRTNQTIYTVQSNKMVHQSGVAGRIFSICGMLGIPVDAITTSATSVSFSAPGDHPSSEKLIHQLKAEVGRVEVRPNMALICCIGNDMADNKGLLSRVAGVLNIHGINIEFDCGHPDANITFIVRDEDYEKAIKCLHAEFIEKTKRRPVTQNW